MLFCRAKIRPARTPGAWDGTPYHQRRCDDATCLPSQISLGRTFSISFTSQLCFLWRGCAFSTSAGNMWTMMKCQSTVPTPSHFGCVCSQHAGGIYTSSGVTPYHNRAINIQFQHWHLMIRPVNPPESAPVGALIEIT